MFLSINFKNAYFYYYFTSIFSKAISGVQNT